MRIEHGAVQGIWEIGWRCSMSHVRQSALCWLLLLLAFACWGPGSVFGQANAACERSEGCGYVAECYNCNAYPIRLRISDKTRQKAVAPSPVRPLPTATWAYWYWQLISSTNVISARRILTPRYWTIPGNVNFNFTGLENDGPFSDFMWSVGQQPGSGETISLQSRTDSSQKFVSYQTGLLVSFFTVDPQITFRCP